MVNKEIYSGLILIRVIFLNVLSFVTGSDWMCKSRLMVLPVCEKKPLHKSPKTLHSCQFLFWFYWTSLSCSAQQRTAANATKKRVMPNQVSQLSHITAMFCFSTVIAHLSMLLPGPHWLFVPLFLLLNRSGEILVSTWPPGSSLGGWGESLLAQAMSDEKYFFMSVREEGIENYADLWELTGQLLSVNKWHHSFFWAFKNYVLHLFMDDGEIRRNTGKLRLIVADLQAAGGEACL